MLNNEEVIDLLTIPDVEKTFFIENKPLTAKVLRKNIPSIYEIRVIKLRRSFLLQF